MAFTPTTLIALTGLLQGNGFVINSTMTDAMTQVNSNPLVSSINSLMSTANAVSGLSDTIHSLPSFIIDSKNQIIGVTNQASGILPASSALGNKDFIQLFNSVDNYVSTTAQINSALSEFNNQNFGNFGIGVSSYGQILTSGVSESLIVLGPSILNFGSVYDFSNLHTVGTPQNLVYSIQQQGYTAINSKILAAGYAFNQIGLIPSSVLTSILTSITGSDLSTIISANNVKVAHSVTTAADLLLVETFLPLDVITTAGLPPGNTGLLVMANHLLNLGVQNATSTKLSNFLSNIETLDLTHLNKLSGVLPISISSILTTALGIGIGPFGNPIMSDLIGTVAGVVHADSFTAILNSARLVSNTTIGQAVTSSATALRSAIVINSGITAAYATFQSAVIAFNLAISGTDVTSVAVNEANFALMRSQSQLTKEINNLNLANISLFNGVTSSTVTVSDLSTFVSRLHDYGTDVNQYGYNAIFNGITSADITGESIQATLVEGRNISNSQLSGKTTPAVANYQKSLPV